MSRHEHQAIWLEPWCDKCEAASCAGDGRLWCQDDVWGQCDLCERKPVKYVLAKSKSALKAGN